jgi:hypothetical protein
MDWPNRNAPVKNAPASPHAGGSLRRRSARRPDLMGAQQIEPDREEQQRQAATTRALQ